MKVVSCIECRYLGMKRNRKFKCPNDELCHRNKISDKERNRKVPIQQRACYSQL